MNRRFFVATVAAGLSTAALAPGVGAGASWSDGDPMLQIKTSGGKTVRVHVTPGAELTGTPQIDSVIRRAVQRAQVSHTAAAGTNSAGEADTLVTVTARIEHVVGAAPYRVRSIVSSKPRGQGTVYGQVGSDGQSPVYAGTDMVVTFWLGVA